MKDSWVEEHRLRNEEEFGDYLDSLCEGIKGHPFVGDRLLDWGSGEGAGSPRQVEEEGGV